VRSLRVALWLHYRGTAFRGWQRQLQGPTVQATVEEALRARGIASGLAAASRTDRGVHARQQVASLRVPPDTDLVALAAALRGPDWGCAAAAGAPRGFHAQWSPSIKEYRYRLCLGAPPARWSGSAWDLTTEPRVAGRRLDPELLARALGAACGRRDFGAFHAASSVRRSRTLESATVRGTHDGLLEARLSGDGFGRYQVRALLGGAALVASGSVPWHTWQEALGRAVQFEGLLAPPHGLILWSIAFAGAPLFAPGAGALCPRLPPFLDADREKGQARGG